MKGGGDTGEGFVDFVESVLFHLTRQIIQCTCFSCDYIRVRSVICRLVMLISLMFFGYNIVR